MNLARRSALALVLPLLTASQSRAQGNEGVKIRARALEITISGRMHEQFNTTSVTSEPGSEFLIRRARPELGVKVNDFVEGALSVDFGEGELDLKDAYVRLNFDPALQITFGQFKRPFDLFELTSSTQILVIERTGKIRGAEVSSLSRFTERLRYSDRDVGVQITGHDRRGLLHWAAALTNGEGANREDEDGEKALVGRLGVSPLKELAVWGGISTTPYATEETAAGEPDPSGDHTRAVAFQVDGEWGNFDHGPHVQAGIAWGDNWRAIEGTDADAPAFVTWQVIGTYKFPVRKNRFVQALEPVFRISQGDPDTDVEDDGGVLLTPGFVVYFAGRNKIAFNYDVWVPQGEDLDTESSFKAQAYLHF
ncbi:MAG: hypothetical protein HY702_06685 [Gemmatimonadetes bacterium]|nr:hypothetical protein [Gemmatimonadota bacterium]